MTRDPGESLALEMASAWARGESLPVEHYLARRPSVEDDSRAVVRLIYEEICLRQERGDEVTDAELARRFPAFADELALMLDCHRLVADGDSIPHWPDVGDSLGEFRLVGELGRGSDGRVFLATQPTLADRPVVLKLVPRRTREGPTLARLQHTHIIPLHGVHDFPSHGLRGLCQPYLGRATLEHVEARLSPIPPRRRTSSDLARAIAEIQATSPVPLPKNSNRRRPAESFADAVARLGLSLAAALRHAHERGLVHLDIKPSNVLLTPDGQPLLLDFHLALGPLEAGDDAPGGLGGTPRYMSPEQRAAFDAARRGLTVPARVDGRSDIHSLGRVMYVLLGGSCEGALFPPLHRVNPAVPRGLSDIVGKCLAYDPAHRYPDAAALADDLRRHLTDMPLAGVPNRSLAERWAKWRRRSPTALHRLALALALAASALALAASWLTPSPSPPVFHRPPPRPERPDPHEPFERGVAAYRAGRYAEAEEAFTEALQRLPGSTEALHNRALTRIARGDRAGAEADVADLRERTRDDAEEAKRVTRLERRVRGR